MMKTLTAALTAAALAFGMAACNRDNAGSGSSASKDQTKRSGIASSGSSGSSSSMGSGSAGAGSTSGGATGSSGSTGTSGGTSK